MKILINVEGVDVEGIILCRTSRDIVVQITSPYQGLQARSHIPYFMTTANFSGPFGDARAQTLLVDLYLCGRFLFQNLESLRKRWAELQTQLRVRAERYTHEDFLLDRREIRSKFRAGETTQKEYERALKEFKLRESKSWETKHSAVQSFFLLNWPEEVPRNVFGIEEALSAPSRGTP